MDNLRTCRNFLCAQSGLQQLLRFFQCKLRFAGSCVPRFYPSPAFSSLCDFLKPGKMGPCSQSQGTPDCLYSLNNLLYKGNNSKNREKWHPDISRNDDPIPTLLQGLCPVTASISRALMTLFSVLMWGTKARVPGREDFDQPAEDEHAGGCF